MNLYDTGRDYVDSMRAIAELNAIDDADLLDYYLNNLEHLSRRWTVEKDADDILRGIHDALLEQFNELVHHRRRRSLHG